MNDVTDHEEKEFDRFSRTYDEEMRTALPMGGRNHDFFTRAKTRRIVELARRFRGEPAGLNILDVGCGPGVTLAELAGHFRSVTGIDVSEEMIREARRRVPSGTFHAYDGTHIPAEDGTFDIIFAINVFHHVPVDNRAPLIRDMARVTAPGGMVALFEHNPLNPMTRHVVKSCAFDEDAILLKPKESTWLLEDAELEIVHARYILFVPFCDWLSDRLDGLLGRLPAGTQYYALGRKRAPAR